MRDIYCEIKELRKNPTPDNIEKINELYGELIDYRDSDDDCLDYFSRNIDRVTVLTLILVSVLLLILCIKIIFLT